MATYIDYGKLDSSISYLESLDSKTKNNALQDVKSSIEAIKQVGASHDNCLSSINDSAISEAINNVSSGISNLVGEISRDINMYSTLEETLGTEVNNATKIKKGHTIAIPKGLGIFATREFDLPQKWAAGTKQVDVQKIWQEKGSKRDKKGFCKIDDRYMVAATSTYGKIGDKVDFHMSDGSVVHTVLGDEKSQTVESWDPTPANKWGHNDGDCIIEFMGSESITNSPYHVLGLTGENVVKAVNKGSILRKK